MSTTRITVLVDNYVRRPGLLAEHGWACWIETSTCRVLFDTGQGHALLYNASELGVPLEQTDAIVLSHGHYDHTGALEAVLKLAPAARVYAHPAAFEAKYGRGTGGSAHEIGIPDDRPGILERIADRLVSTIAPTEVCRDVQVTGQIARTTGFEDPGGPFYLDKSCQHPDPLVDDQALVIRTAAGTAVVLGCAHAGVINTLEYVARLANRAAIHTVIGGMHLGAASDERIDRTIGELRRRDIKRIVAAHCTGANAFAALRAGLPARGSLSEAGMSLAWEDG